MENTQLLDDLSMDECICLSSSLPYFKDFVSGALYTTGRYAAEFLFWKEFFKDSATLSRDFQKRVQEAPRGFIQWDFIRPGDQGLTVQSMAAQYREALTFAEDCFRGSNCHLNKNRQNLLILEQYANQVIANREAQLEAHKNDGNIHIRAVHQEIHHRWLKVRDAIREAISKL